MPEPLTEEQLQLAQKLSGILRSEGRPGAANLVVILLAEVARLRAERAACVATPAQVIRLIRAGEAVVRDAYSEDDDVCEVDASRIRFLESALEDIGPIPEEESL